MSIKDNVPVAIFTLEDTESQLVSKIISNYCEIDNCKIKNGLLTTEELQELEIQIKRITEAEIYVDCSPRLQIQDLCTKSIELDIPVFVISQMNRNAETDKDRFGFEGRRPRLSDLRDSGTLCDDADIVCFIFRPEYYHLTEDAQGNSLIGIAEIIIAKNRNGYETVQNLNFKGECSLFKEKY